ncbi:MAG: type 4a pilus biogenesis protein PilO [Bacillota bacterium]
MSLSRRERIMLLVLLAAGLGMGLYYALNWYIKDLNRLSAEKAAKAEELRRVEEKCADLATVERKLAEARRLQADYEHLVPKDAELPQLLRDTATMMAAAGVELVSFTPGTPSSVPNMEGLNQLNVAVQTKGTYGEILKMFESLRSGRRLIGIKDFSVGGAKSGEADPELSCSFNMVVFFTGGKK